METIASSSTFLLAVLLMFSVQGLAVVARVRLAGTTYVIMEREEKICIDAINDDYNPENPLSFSVNYMYDTELSGSGGGNRQRADQVIFYDNSNTAQICITHHDNTEPCERNITGRVTLSGSDLVAIGQPNTAQVTIVDDDFIDASFVEPFYSLLEGGDTMIPALVNVSHLSAGLMLEVVQESTNVNSNTVGRSLRFEPITITFDNAQEGVTLNVEDDEIALEDPEDLVMRLSVPNQALCSNVNFSPFELTRLHIIDNDSVILELTRSSVLISEGESYSACVTLTRHIARQLDVALNIRSDTANLNDLAIQRDRHMLTFTPTSEITKCVEIGTIQDHVIESDETFTVELEVLTVLPASIRPNLKVGTTSSTITIRDTSTCTDVFLDPLSTSPTIYVQESRTLCFSCPTCNTWNVTSYQGHTWGGTSNEQIDSPFRGQVLANGNLLIHNSSQVFSKSSPGILSFGGSVLLNASMYEVYIQEVVEITELTVSCTPEEAVAIISCRYRGSPAPEITWWEGSHSVQGETNLKSEGEYSYRSTLLVDSSTSKTYTCRVSNGIESRDSTVITNCNKVISNAINSSSSLSTANYFMSYFAITLIISQYL